MLIWCWLTAFAAGPWVPGTGRTSMFVGVEGQRFTRLAAYGEDEVVDFQVGEGISTIKMFALVSHGLSPRASIEMLVPFHHAHASREDAQLCGDIGLDACRTTNVIGDIEVHLKGLALDELSGAPLSLAVVGEVRYGALAAHARGRLTGPGVATLDLGPIVSIGRSGALGSGYFAGSFDVGWRYRLPHTNQYPQLTGNETVPASEFHSAFELILAPIPEIGLGPAANLLYRPWGRDFLKADFGDIDRFSSLRVADLRVGGKLILKDANQNAFVFSVYRTAYAWNNPSDTFSVGAGVNIANLFKRRAG